MTAPLPTQPEEVKTSPEARGDDIVDLLKNNGYHTVEGMDAVLKIMEEMANQPKEEHGKRQPGERCMYEIQRQL